MSLFLKAEVENGTIGIWEIEESLEKLESLALLSNFDKQQYQQFKNQSRKKQWLAIRVLLQTILSGTFQIKYTEEGRPFLENNIFNVSISHTECYAVIILSKEKRIGIDIERVSSKFMKVVHKYANPNELNLNVPMDEFSFLCLIWSVKEALFKAIDEKSIIFKDDLIIFKVDKEEVLAKVMRSNKEEIWKLNYQKINDCFLVWCVKTEC